MDALPIDRFLPEIVERLRGSRSLVLVAPPGAGKTTRVPPAILRAGLLGRQHPNLVMLQPRRVAARASAMRIAEENHWTLGREVGYHIRFERKLSSDTRLRVLTEGVLTRQLLSDPYLEGVGAVLLDEFHERSLHTDVAIALLREVQQTVREDLMLVVMSATLDAEPVARFLGNCPIIRAEGRAFPVDISYAPAAQTPLPDQVHDVLAATLDDQRPATSSSAPVRSDTLVFLPGMEEIRRTQRRLESLAAQRDLLLLPLHGSLPAEEQTRALRPARQTRIILATNVAETSLTIDGVRTVIDSGLARVAGYDPQRGLDRLDLKRISKASATQRAGRAGRTAPGRCVRLWSEREHATLDDFELPEVRRVDLCGAVLALHAWGKPDPRAFGWYEAPPESILVAAEKLLAMLGALTGDADGQITPLGRKILSLPVHPRLARLLIAGAEVECLDDAASLAALLSEKDILFPSGAGRPTTDLQGDSDLIVRLQFLDEAERSRFDASLRDRGIDPLTARQVARTRDELLRTARRIRRGDSIDARAPTTDEGDDDSNPACGFTDQPARKNGDALLKLVLFAYPDRVARRRGSDPFAGVMVGGGGARLSPESIVRRAEFFVAVDARQDERSSAREAFVRVASAIEVQWLEELFPASIRRERAALFDAERLRVVGVNRLWYRDLLLREDADVAVDADRAAEVLSDALRPRAAELFTSDPAAASLLARIALLRRFMPEKSWPAFDDVRLAELLTIAARGKRSVEELTHGALAAALMTALAYPLDRLLEQHAPPSITVPTGNAIRVHYAMGQAPVLAVRLQELFGWTDTPRIAGGRVPVVLHLLGPNYRPVQITDDLRSFWSTTYFQVRKDLRTRYPKHSWPEDPLSAKPEARGNRRR